MSVRRAGFAVAVLAAAPAAVAQPNLAETYFQNGTRAFAEHRYDEAARAFREALAISHRPELFFNLSRALEQQGDYAGALQALQDFSNGGAPGFDRVALAQMISTLQPLAARQREREAAALAAGRTPVVEVRTVERPVIEPRWYRVEYRRSAVHAVVPWTLVGVGAALGIAGIAEALVGNGAATTLRSVNSGSEPWSQGAADAQSSAGGDFTRAYILGGAGAALAVGGALWLILRGPGQRVEVRDAPRVSLAPAGLGLSFGGSL